jgi:trans-aconitate 2-methyltransferase
MLWDPHTYLSFEAERTRPAAELLARVPNKHSTYVVDLGCGPGNSTALLASRWPTAFVEGIDSSPDMLVEAVASSTRAQWVTADIADWTPRQKADVIFANAALQWLPDHQSLMPRLLSFLDEGGTLAFQVPRNFDEPCHTLIRDVARDGPWASKLGDIRDWRNVCTPEAYFAILEPHASRVEIWETRYLYVLEGEDAVFRWMSGTGLRPFVAALEGDEREAFLAEYKTHLAKAYPKCPSGKTLYPFQRLFAVVTR